MPIQQDFGLVLREDGVIQTVMEPSTNIAGWNLQTLVTKRPGHLSGLIVKSAASGYGGGQSGITITNSGQGIFTTAINSVDSSGFDPGAYAYRTERLDSGFRSVLTEGYLNFDT